METNEESGLFKSITERSLTFEQEEEYKIRKRLNRGWVSQDSESGGSNSSDDDMELSLDSSLFPGESAASLVNKLSAVFAGEDADEQQHLLNRYINGEITFVEFTDLQEQSGKNVEGDDSLNQSMEVDENSGGDESEENAFVDDRQDEDYVPPKHKKKVNSSNEATGSYQDTKLISSSKEAETAGLESVNEETTNELKKKEKKARKLKTDLPRELHDIVGQANMCLVHGNHQVAIQLLLEVIRIAPKYPEPFRILGMIYEEMGDMTKSLQYALIAAYLMPNDSEEWTRLGEMSLERNNIHQAIICFGKAIRSDPTNVDLMWVRCQLFEELGEQKKMLEQLQQIAKAYKPEEGEMIMQVTRDITRRLFDSGKINQAKSTMVEAFEKHSDFITSEDVNLLLELMMKLEQYEESIKILIQYCGVEFEPPLQDQEVSKLLLEDRKLITPEVLPIDLSVKLLICLLHLKAQHLTSVLKLTLLEESPEEMGDLYLDVAEAYMELRMPEEALPLLSSLAGSEKYHLPFVWQKYGECRMALGDLTEAERIYRHVVELAPSHTAARMVLSGILQQLGRPDESLSVLTSGIEETIDMDPALQIQRANLLYSRGDWEEFIYVAKLLHSAHTVWRNECADANSNATCSTNKIREYFKLWSEEMNDEILIKADSIHCEEIWDIYKKMCQKMLDLERYEELEYVTLTAQASTIFTDKEILKDCHFMHLLACYFNRDLERAYQMIKLYVSWDDSTNRPWNIFNLIIGLLRQLKHNRFCIRLMYKNPDHIQLGMLNGHTAFAAGSYKHALGEYMNVFKNNPKEPVIALCIGLTYTHIACQKYSNKKHSLVLQATAFFNLYRELRGDGQETYYNIGRALHQLGFVFVAVDYYKKALKFPPAVAVDPSGIYDLRFEIAYNLSLIYSRSGNTELARVYISKYCVI